MDTDGAIDEAVSISFEIVQPGDAMDGDDATESVHVHFHIRPENAALDEMEGVEMAVEGRNFEADEGGSAHLVEEQGDAPHPAQGIRNS